MESQKWGQVVENKGVVEMSPPTMSRQSKSDWHWAKSHWLSNLPAMSANHVKGVSFLTICVSYTESTTSRCVTGSFDTLDMAHFFTWHPLIVQSETKGGSKSWQTEHFVLYYVLYLLHLWWGLRADYERLLPVGSSASNSSSPPSYLAEFPIPFDQCEYYIC